MLFVSDFGLVPNYWSSLLFSNNLWIDLAKYDILIIARRSDVYGAYHDNASHAFIGFYFESDDFSKEINL